MSYALYPVWWAAWLAPAPAIIAALSAPTMHRRWLTLLTGAIGGFSSFSYHVEIAGWVIAIGILVLVALAWSSAIRLAALFAERKRFFPAVFAIPVVWAAIDTLLIHLSPHGSAGSIAYSQMDALAVIQIASIGGVPAVTFLVLLGRSLLGFASKLITISDRTVLLRASILAVMVIASSLIFGALRLQTIDETSGPPSL